MSSGRREQANRTDSPRSDASAEHPAVVALARLLARQIAHEIAAEAVHNAGQRDGVHSGDLQ